MNTKRITCTICGNKFWQTPNEDGKFKTICPNCIKPKKEKQWEKKKEL